MTTEADAVWRALFAECSPLRDLLPVDDDWSLYASAIGGAIVVGVAGAVTGNALCYVLQYPSALVTGIAAAIGAVMGAASVASARSHATRRRVYALAMACHRRTKPACEDRPLHRLSADEIQVWIRENVGLLREVLAPLD